MQIGWQELAAMAGIAAVVGPASGLIVSLFVQTQISRQLNASSDSMEKKLGQTMQSTVAAEVGKVRIEIQQVMLRAETAHVLYESQKAVIEDLRQRIARLEGEQ